MDIRLALHELTARHGLDASAADRLAAHAGLGGEPAGLTRQLARGTAVLAAALIGLGLVCWIAANWESLGRTGRFALLQGFVAVTLLGALLRPAARAPLSLMALLGIGGLFAYFGQTYQTGADPWQLFALWAALVLPLALAVRSDVLWAPWALVAMTGVSLWVQAHTGHRWRVEPHDLATHAIGWAAAMAVIGALSPALRRFTGAGAWALRTAVVLTVVLITTGAMWALFSRTVSAHYALGLAVLAGLFAVAATRRFFDVFALSAVALGLNVLLTAGLARWVFDGPGDFIGELLLIGLAAAALLAATVSLVLRLARHYASGVEAAAPAGTDSPPPSRVEATLRAAIADGLLPADAALPDDTGRPWPVVLLTALGAWLAAIPLLGVVGLLLGDLLERGVGPYLVGLLMLAGAVVVLRARGVPLFVEQLALPALLVGGGALGFGLFRDLPTSAAAALLAALALAVAAAVRAPWLRALLGAVAAGLFIFACAPPRDVFDMNRNADRLGLALHAALAIWVGALALGQRLLRGAPGAHAAAALESIAAGWLPAVLWGLCVWSGMTFLVGASGGFAAQIAQEVGRGVVPRGLSVLPWLSLALAVGAAAWIARSWPGVRRPVWVAAAVVLAGLAWVMPALGAVLLATALCAASGRWRLAAAGAVAAAWIVGAFYYQLEWSLTAKALVLVGAGALLGALAWLAAGARMVRTAAPARASWSVGIALGLVAVLAVANMGIWQKERLIADGAPVFVELAPVDPRSLMQGDYMRLAYRLPNDLERGISPLGGERPHVVAKRDARGVATVLRLDDGTPLAADELRIEMTPSHGDWTLVSDAWFFKEGEARRFEPARYAEFRVSPSGQALLVGLRNAQLGAL